MKRSLFCVAVGLILAAIVQWVDLPFRSALYSVLLRLRGPVAPHSKIVIVSTLDSPPGVTWQGAIRGLLDRLEENPPRAVELDFDLREADEELISAAQRSFPVFWHTDEADFQETEPLLPLVSSPDHIDASGRASPDPFLLESPDIQLMREVDPFAVERVRRMGAQMINVVGPPGSFRRVTLREVVESESIRKELEGKILLVSAPREKGSLRFGTLPFFPKVGTTGWDETEIHANAIDTILRGRGIRLADPKLSLGLNLVVSTITVVVLFNTAPVIGIFVVVLLTILLVLAGVLSLSHFVFLDLTRPIFSIFFSYYFLIPYRLILEYKGRWRYQQENKLLAEVETLKSNFMSLVSHNLKTPLARIEGIVETLLPDPSIGEKAKDGLRSILQSAEELGRFISRVLSLSRVEHPQFQLHVASRDLNAVVEKLAEIYRPQAAQKSIELTTKIEPLFPIRMDGDLIQESIANLVENAIKYTPSNGHVLIETRDLGSTVGVFIHDDGPGINPEDANKLFSKFYRGVLVKNKGIRGSGLGLYLVKYFVELHGGTVNFENREGGGTTFSITLQKA